MNILINVPTGLTTEQQEKKKKELKDMPPSRLYFSDRLFIDIEFQKYCLETNTQYCILNFLAWLSHYELKEQILQALKNETIV